MRTRTRHTITLLGAAPLGLVALACVPTDLEQLAAVERVVLISIDTLRPDHLGVYGADLPMSPNIDELAERSAVFHHAISSTPLTLPSHATLLTGTDPPRHGVHDNSTYRLADSQQTLAEILLARGFRTGAVVGSVVLDRRFGLAQGFEIYDDALAGMKPAGGALGYLERNAQQVTDRGIELLHGFGRERFFLFLHYYDPHQDWKAPAPWRDRFGDNGYAAEIAYTDAQVGRLLAELAVLGIDDSTAVILTSDHGESLGAFGELSHSYFIYQVTQAVPLIVHIPGMEEQRDIDHLVGIVDVVPSVLAMLGIERSNPLEGRDLAAHWRGVAPAAATAFDRVLFAESLTPTKLGCNPLFAAVGERWKYIHTRRPELYDLAADPGERHNLVDQEPQIAAQLKAQLERMVSVGGGAPAGRYEVDVTTQEQLEQLGYLGSRVDDRLEIDETRDDPKDCLDLFELYASLVLHTRNGDWDLARRTAELLLDKRPDLADVYRYLGLIAVNQKRWSNAHSHLRLYFALSGAEQDPTSGLGPLGVGTNRQRASAFAALGVALSEVGRRREALDAFRSGIGADPTLPGVHYNLALALIALGREAEAIAPLRRTLGLDPSHTSARRRLEQLGAR